MEGNVYLPPSPVDSLAHNMHVLIECSVNEWVEPPAMGSQLLVHFSALDLAALSPGLPVLCITQSSSAHEVGRWVDHILKLNS